MPASCRRSRRGTGGAGGRTGRDGRWTGACSGGSSHAGERVGSNAGASWDRCDTPTLAVAGRGFAGVPAGSEWKAAESPGTGPFG